MKLVPVPPGVDVIACSTCHRRGDPRDAAQGPAGARLLAALREAQAGQASTGVAVRAMPCLFACAEACTVHLRAPGKIGYVLGRFRPDAATAQAILTFAAHYAVSETGEVAFAVWPEAVKGHFLTRTPPEGFLVA